MPETEYFLFQRGGMNLQIMAPFLEFPKHYPKYFGVPISKFFFSFTHDRIKYCIERNWSDKLAEWMVDCYLENNWRSYPDFFKKLDYCSKQGRKAAAKIKSANLSLLKDKELYTLYKQLFDVATPFHTLSAIGIDVLDMSLPLIIEKYISQKIRKDNLTQALKDLSIPLEKTYLQKRDASLFKLALLFRENSKSPKIKKAIDRHLKNYWWADFAWVPREPLTFEKLIGDIIKLAKSKKDFNLELRKIDTHLKQVSQKRKYWLKIINDKKVNKLMEFLDKLALYHDYRKEAQLKMVYSNNLILKEIERRNKNLSFDLLLFARGGDIMNHLQGKKKPDRKLLKRIYEKMLYYTDGKKIEFLIGKKAQEREDRELSFKKEKDIRELKGSPASSGRARGRVIIVWDPKKAFKKIKKGQILVTGQTTPDFVPVMKLSSAVVTDEGGATCHAAIVSRELGKPCVVGTITATKVFKTGDLIEVDGDKGIIRKI